MGTTRTNARRDAQELYDRAEITDLVYRLGMTLDEARFDELGELLIEEAAVRTPGGQSHGRRAMVAQASRNHPADQRFQHAISNVLVDLDGDRATVRANLVVHIAVPGDAPADAPVAPRRTALGEVYRFEVVRTAQGWRFSRVETVPVWVSGVLPPTPTRAA